MSFLGLSIAGSALDSFQDAESVTSDNIANVQTPGASRQVVNLSEATPIDGSPFYPGNFSPGTLGTGVVVSSITRVHQDSYDALFRGATGAQNYYNTEQQVLSGLQSSLGEPSNGINSAYTNFQTAVQTLANNPSGIPERTGLLTSAQALVTQLNSAGATITSQEASVQGQASTMINTINSTLDQIAALNGQIRALTAVGNNPNTYEDQRDTLIDTLSTYMSTTTSVQADGSTLVSVNGLALVNDTVAYHLATPVVGTNPNGTPVLEVGFVGDPTPSNSTLPVDVGSGQLGGLLDVYNNKLIPYLSQLNNFANGLANESDRISQAGYDLTGQPGGQLFSPVVSQLPIGAGNIQVGLTTASEVPAASATTAAGTLIQPLNSANNTVDTTVAINNNSSLANPPAIAAGADIAGTLTVSDDGINQVVNYQINSAVSTPPVPPVPAGTIDATTIGGFITAFNAQQLGVTASFNPTSQTVVFARDPTNVGLVHRALQGANPTTPDFTITDSNVVGVGPAQPALGTPATALLTALGANQINGVNQNATNAFGATNGGNVSALLSVFTASLGAPSLQVQTAIPAAGYAAGQSVTVTGPAGPPPPFATLNVGNVLTIYDGVPPTTANQENVTITAVNRNLNTITFTVAKAHPAAQVNLYITSAQTQTLQQSYANLVSQIGLDTQTAITGNSTQTSLTSSVNQVRQGVDGINIDEETQNLVKFQNAYGAAAHVVSTLSAMLSDAVNLGSGTTF